MKYQPGISVFLRWPVQKFFWNVLDAPGLRARGPLPAALQDQVARTLPVPLSQVALARTPTDDGRWLICAILRTDLASVEHRTYSFYPDSVPPHLGVNADPALLDFVPESKRLTAAPRGPDILTRAWRSLHRRRAIGGISMAPWRRTRR